MRVWRLVGARFAPRAFDGGGARMFGGRWNSKGVEVVYAAGSLSLAALETLVHLDADTFPSEYVAIPAEIPDHLPTRRVDPTDLPAAWRQVQDQPALQAIGDEWVRQAQTAVLSVPSAVVPFESNFLLNPNHSDARRVQIGEPRPFSFDPRLWSR